jgi:predicted nucleic-acid-binding Zn-ribbon protein
MAPPATVTQPVLTQQQVSVDPDGTSDLGTLLRQDGYTTEKAQSLRDAENCPNCGSTNYMRASGHPNSMKQCFECGNNPRFEQMAAGINGAVKTQGPVRAARVQNPETGMAPMGSIIQHI